MEQLGAVVVGLEVHVQLATASKLFCGCPNRFGAPPNTLVCPVCLGHPGALPQAPNRRAVELAAGLALALGCTVHRRSRFARKAYAYPDLPKGYQITQRGEPLATGGRLPLPGGGEVGIRRVHLEEDAARLRHGDDGATLIDFNRCGVPLAEVVTEPALADGAAAAAALRSLQGLLLDLGASAASLEEGSLRCDVNVSVRTRGGGAGERAELKNLNSLRGLRRAVGAEAARQRRALAGGGAVERQTRGFDPGSGATFARRHKEAGEDYAWLDEPDLPELTVTPERLAALRDDLPEPPWERRERLVAAYGLADDEAAVIARRGPLAAWFEAAAADADPRAVARWLRTEVLHLAGDGDPWQALPPRRLAGLVAMVERGRLSGHAGKAVLRRMWGSDEGPEDAAERLGLASPADEAEVEAWAEEVLAAHPDLVARWRGGRRQLLGFFVGRVVGRSGGTADPRAARRALERRLAAGPAAP